MSQIPGINGCEEVRAAGSTRPYYRDSDSNYVRLAKQGGTKDLLNYQESDLPRKAVSYARNNWFYLEDNAIEDAKTKEDANWKFGVPDYMATGSRSLESGEPTHELQKMEDLRITDNGRAKEETLTSPQAEQSFPDPSVSYEYPMAPFRQTGHVSFDKTETENQPEIKNERTQMSQVFPPYYNIERAKAVVPEPEFKNPILQNDFYTARSDGYSKKQGTGNREGSMDICNSLPAGFTRKQGNDREGPAVSMSKLLSHDYGKEWHANLPPGPRSESQEPDFQGDNNNQHNTNRTPEIHHPNTGNYSAGHNSRE